MANPNINYLTYAVIKKGSKGADVKFAQKQLKVYMPSEAYYVVVDGDFGTVTDTAVKAFQKKCGLTQDGVIGAETWRRLGPQVNNSLTDHYPGFKKESIAEVQRLLRLGNRCLDNPDGLWGLKTENGIKGFQRDYGLTQDAIWGRQCWGIIEQGWY